MGHYLFNLMNGHGPTLREIAAGRLGVGLWGVDAGERHRDALAR